MFKNVTLTHKNNTLLNKETLVSFILYKKVLRNQTTCILYIFTCTTQNLITPIHTIHIIESELITHTEMMKRISDHVRIFRAMYRHSTFINCSS